jgi:hypothetical protein
MMEVDMSQKAFVEFYQTYLPGPKGKAVVSKLKAVKEESEYCTIAVEAGRAAGYDFTADEVRTVMKTSEAKRKQASGELSEKQLETAVGGAMAPLTVELGASLTDSALPMPGPDGRYSTVMCPW